MKGFSKYGKLLSVFLILPTVFLVIYVVFIANSEIDVEDVLSVSISDGRYLHRYSGTDDIEEYVFFVLNSTDNVLQEIKDDAPLYTIEFEMKNGSKKEYSFYPSLRGDSLIKDGAGILRKAKNVSELLLRVEYKDIYASRYLPTVSLLTVDGNANIIPTEYSWSYKKTQGDFCQYTELETLKEPAIFSVSAEALKKGAVSFSVSPDDLKTAYTYNGSSYSKLEDMSLTDGDEIEITLSASWKKTESCMFYGEAKFVFCTVYKESPIITLDKNTAILGECLVLYADNVDAGEKLSIKTDMFSQSALTVYEGKERNFALLPIDVKTHSGDYNISVSYRDTDFQFSVNVTAVSNGFFIKNVNTETYNAVTSPTGIEEYESFISSLANKTSKSFLWESEKLLPPVESEVEIPFAAEVLYNTLPPQVYFEGESFAVAQKTSVKSSAKGKVVFSGETAKSGKAVVIDHGCGIMTHYYHLSVISVTEGEEIEAGKLIGLSGNSGFTDKEDLYFAVSVGGVFVNPTLFME